MKRKTVGEKRKYLANQLANKLINKAEILISAYTPDYNLFGKREYLEEESFPICNFLLWNASNSCLKAIMKLYFSDNYFAMGILLRTLSETLVDYLYINLSSNWKKLSERYLRYQKFSSYENFYKEYENELKKVADLKKLNFDDVRLKLSEKKNMFLKKFIAETDVADSKLNNWSGNTFKTKYTKVMKLAKKQLANKELPHLSYLDGSFSYLSRFTHCSSDVLLALADKKQRYLVVSGIELIVFKFLGVYAYMLMLPFLRIEEGNPVKKKEIKEFLEIVTITVRELIDIGLVEDLEWQFHESE